MTFETLNESYDLVVIGAGPAGARLLRAQLQSQT